MEAMNALCLQQSRRASWLMRMGVALHSSNNDNSSLNLTDDHHNITTETLLLLRLP
jgi:hypothetical protein